MSASPRPAESHGHGHLTPRGYVAIWALLVVLTGITVGVTYLDMKKFAIFTALLIASFKASLVLLYFMHLRQESRILTFILLVGLATLAIFTGLTFSDVAYRFH